MAITKGRIKAISVSEHRGTPKTNVAQAELKADFGIVGDAHAGSNHRQVSLLSVESLDRLREKGVSVSAGDFAENILTEGLDVRNLQIGSRLRIGRSAELEVTQLGKHCRSRCKVFERVGDCIMPREGIFARAAVSGKIVVGDVIEVVDDKSRHTDGQ